MIGAVDWDGPARQPCPECSRGPKDKTLGVTVQPDGSGVAHCFRCEYVECHREDDTYRRPGTRQAPAAAAVRYEVLSADWRRQWNEGKRLHDNVGASYLQARNCVIPPDDGHMRFHPAIKHWPSGVIAPALLALGTDVVTGEPITMHITFVQADGTKAKLDPPRLLAPGHRKKGAVVRLWPDEAVTLGLGIAEGIETALSLAHAYSPVWACIDAGNLGAFPVLRGIESLMIAADHDPAGIAASDACARRWAAANLEAFIVMPDELKTDLNDIARSA